MMKPNKQVSTKNISFSKPQKENTPRRNHKWRPPFHPSDLRWFGSDGHWGGWRRVPWTNQEFEMEEVLLFKPHLRAIVKQLIARKPQWNVFCESCRQLRVYDIEMRELSQKGSSEESSRTWRSEKCEMCGFGTPKPQNTPENQKGWFPAVGECNLFSFPVRCREQSGEGEQKLFGPWPLRTEAEKPKGRRPASFCSKRKGAWPFSEFQVPSKKI